MASTRTEGTRTASAASAAATSAGLVGLRQREQLLELIDEQQQAACRLVGRARRVLADRAGDPVGRVAQQRGERRLVGVRPHGERGGERAHRVAARHDVDPRPAVVVDQPRQHAGPAQRRLAGARVAADDDERLAPHAIDQLADLAAPAEEQRAVRRLERGEAAVRIAVGHAGRGRRRGALLERDHQRVGRGEPRAGIALDQAIDDRGERRIDAGRDVAEPRHVAMLDDVAEHGHRDAAVRRGAGQQLVEQDARASTDPIAGSPARRATARAPCTAACRRTGRDAGSREAPRARGLA